jgi:hypothetical protein
LPGRSPAGAFAVAAPRPATGPTLAFLQLLLGSANAAFSGHLLLGIDDPADELVARQRRDVPPGTERRGVGDERLAQVKRKLVDNPAGHSFAAHKTTLAVCEAARRVQGDPAAKKSAQRAIEGCCPDAVRGSDGRRTSSFNGKVTPSNGDTVGKNEGIAPPGV